MPVQFASSRFGDRLLAGDESVLRDVQSTFWPGLRRMLDARLAHQMQAVDADEVFNLALFRLWDNRRFFDPRRGSLRTWLGHITINIARNLIKRNRAVDREAMKFVDPAQLDARAGNGRTASAFRCLRVRIALSGEAAAALSHLSDIQRKIVLADSAAPSGVESASVLAQEFGITAGAVRVNRRRALRRLRAALDAPRSGAIERRGEKIIGHSV